MATCAPSRITVIQSARAKTSSKRWEMNNTAAPWACRVRGDGEKPVNFDAAESRRRFVHDQDARVERNGLGDFHHLLVGNRETLRGPVGVDFDPQLLKELAATADASPSGRSGAGTAAAACP